MSNTFGSLFRLSTFGESHGPAVGAVIDGCPAGVRFDVDLLRRDLARRRPGGSQGTTRNETDEPVLLSGVYNDTTTGAPIAIIVENRDQRSSDYDALKDIYRPSHADFTYDTKYGVRDHRGGGRASARETLARVIGGAVARMMLGTEFELDFRVAVTRIGPIVSSRPVESMSPENIYRSPVRCDDPAAERLMLSHIEYLRSRGDSSGGVVSACITGLPPGLGEPVYDKFNGRLAAAMMSINGAMGVEIGAGFAVAERRGSENNDAFVSAGERLATSTNNSGGIQGGITNGMPITFRVAFKPPSSIAQTQTHGLRSGGVTQHQIDGRHDPTIVVRATPVVEAMALLVVADVFLMSRAGASFVTADRAE